MYPVIAFLLVLGEILTVIVSFAIPSQAVFYTALVYGSPFYLVMNLFRSESVLFDSPIYIAIGLFHVFKYLFMALAQIRNERGGLFYLAVVLEILYLCLSAYYIN